MNFWYFVLGWAVGILTFAVGIYIWAFWSVVKTRSIRRGRN